MPNALGSGAVKAATLLKTFPNKGRAAFGASGTRSVLTDPTGYVTLFPSRPTIVSNSRVIRAILPNELDFFC